MASHHSTLSPAPVVTPAARRSLRTLAYGTGFRIKLKPRRDALTRVRHDLRSLVQSVVGYADLLTEPRYGALSPEQERFVHNVRTAAQHLTDLVDTYVELSKPENDQTRTLEPPLVQLGQTLRRVRNTLLSRELCCDLTVSPELETRCLNVDVVALERALCGLAEVLTREGAVTLQLRVSAVGARITLQLHTSDAPEASALAALDSLEDQLGNRDFVRLKLSEVLLGRQGFAMKVAPELDVAEMVVDLRH